FHSAKCRRRAMDIYAYLKKDHDKVKKLMDQITEATTPEDRKELFDAMSSELLLHASTEEQTFYRALEERGGKQLQEKAGHAEEEHDEIETLIQKLRKSSPEESSWLITFGSLKHAVEHHVEEEEGEIFEKARKVLSDLQAEKLAEEMDMLKQQRKARPAAAAARPAQRM